MMRRPPEHRPARHPRGEAAVWLSATGLALGLLLVVGLLVLIGWQGTRLFWPHPVLEVVLKEGSEDRLAGSRVLAGRLTRKQDKATEPGREWQLQVGNKEVYGIQFHYLDVAAIEQVSRPQGLIVAERTEYGDALFHARSLQREDGSRIAATEPGFTAALREALAVVAERRAAIEELERVEIGRLNERMERLQRQLVRALPGSTAHRETAAELSVLQARYEDLARRARALREAQEAGSLTYRLATGQVEERPLGDFLRFHYPNDLRALERMSLFVQNFWRFLTQPPREANTEGGIFPAIFGTFVMTLLMSVLVMPFGVLAAVYLHEYASHGPLVGAIRISVNNLAGVPSIVFGVFGLSFFVYFVGGSIDELFFHDRLPSATFGTGGIFWASLTLALLTVPVVIVATEEALAAVPRGVREASLGCGASKWQTIRRVVLPVSAPGILTGLILAMARGAGEVAPLMLVGVVKLAPTLPLDAEFPYLHLERKFMHLGFHVYDLAFQSPDSEATRPIVFATCLLLIGLVIVLNLGAAFLRQHLRRKLLVDAL